MPDQRDGGIAWTDETWNVVRGCSDVNEDCRHCYAKNLAATRLSQPGQPYHGLAELRNGKAYWTGKVELVKDLLLKPYTWTRPRKIFVNAMSDLFHEDLPDTAIDQIVAMMTLCQQHIFQVLTKRPGRMASYLNALGNSRDENQIHRWLRTWGIEGLNGRNVSRADTARASMGISTGIGSGLWPLRNVWWGASMGHQAAVERFMPQLLKCRSHAWVLWVSAEPLLEQITFEHTLRDIDWLVVGGESGKDARPMHPAWPKALQREAELFHTGFHFKQQGEWMPVVYQNPEGKSFLKISCGMDGKRERIVAAGPDRSRDINMVKVGKKAAGRLLDGREWNEWPRQGQHPKDHSTIAGTRPGGG